MNIKLEICCGNAEDVIRAEKAGADRLELCAAMELGGLTPTPGMMMLASKETEIPIMAMVRPRTSGFCYTQCELAVMRADIVWLLTHGAKGVVFGVLTDEGKIDVEANRLLVDTVRELSDKTGADYEIVFHRAIDVCSNWRLALEQIIDLGFGRVLTSGGHANAQLGAERIKQMIAQADGRIEVMPGAGVNAENVEEILFITGANQVHSTCSSVVRDSSCARMECKNLREKEKASSSCDDVANNNSHDDMKKKNLRVNDSDMLKFNTGGISETNYKISDAAKIARLRRKLDEFSKTQSFR